MIFHRMTIWKYSISICEMLYW